MEEKLTHGFTWIMLNALFIIVGALFGRLFQNIPEKMKETALSIIGFAVAVLGIQMGFESNNFVIVIISLVVGAVLGEWLDLERLFNRFGHWVEQLVENKSKQENQGIHRRRIRDGNVNLCHWFYGHYWGTR